MYEQTVIKQLKQTNISRDGEKTKERVAQVWKAASRQQKQEVEALADIARASIYRVYNTGSLSAKLAMSMAQVLRVSPFYLTAVSDENPEFSETLLDEFLVACGYRHLVPESKKTPRKKRTRPQPADSVSADALPNDRPSEPDAPPTVSLSEDADTQAFLSQMTEEDMILLMRALLLRAKAGGQSAELADQLKRLLIS